MRGRAPGEWTIPRNLRPLPYPSAGHGRPSNIPTAAAWSAPDVKGTAQIAAKISFKPWLIQFGRSASGLIRKGCSSLAVSIR